MIHLIVDALNVVIQTSDSYFSSDGNSYILNFLLCSKNDEYVPVQDLLLLGKTVEKAMS